MEKIPTKERLKEIPSVEELKEKEKEFSYCFAESTVPVLFALRDIVKNGEVTSAGFKDYLQSQNLPTIDELQTCPVSEWEDLMFKKNREFKAQRQSLITPTQKSALETAINERRIMSGHTPSSIERNDLPRYSSPGSMFRDFATSVPFPDRSAFRINIPDHPGELPDEIILNRIVKKLWNDPLFQKHGFGAKILGSVKTDTIILYVGENTVNKAMEIVIEDARSNGYGFGEAARFGQTISQDIPGITLTSNPEDGTFGQVISQLLSETLNERTPRNDAEQKIERLLALDVDDWIYDAIEPLFQEKAKAMFGNKLYLHNLAFIDKG